MSVSSVVLLSGGLDSAANLAICRERDNPVLAVTADYGQRAANAELRAAISLCGYYGIRHQVVDLRWLGGLGGSALTDAARDLPVLGFDQLDDAGAASRSARAVWVPNRNGVLINTAAAFAERVGAEQVVVGFNREEAATFPDNSAEFLSRATASLALSTANQVRVTCYTTELDKREIVAAIGKLSRPFPFEKVWSCYRDGEVPCQECESCRRFLRATGASA